MTLNEKAQFDETWAAHVRQRQEAGAAFAEARRAAIREIQRSGRWNQVRWVTIPGFDEPWPVAPPRADSGDGPSIDLNSIGSCRRRR